LLCSLSAANAASSDNKLIAAYGPDVEVKEFRLDDLRATLQSMPPGAERDYFAGVLANRSGQIQKSIGLLEDALPHIRSNPVRAATAREALADDYNKSFRYADADRAYTDLLQHYSAQLPPHPLQGTRDDAGVMHLLRKAPAQTIEWHGPVRLKTEWDAIGSRVTQLTVNGVSGQWLLDTGANLSVLSRSFAQKLGLKPLPGFGQTMSGLTGIENRLQVAVLPSLTLGGATLHNVVFLILDDANLRIDLPKKSYQINAIIGYPVFQTLGVITFLHDNYFEANADSRKGSGGTRMYMKLLMPVIECGITGNELPFTFDTGADGTLLSVRYYNRFRSESGGWKQGQNITGGGGGAIRRTVYLQPKLDLAVGTKVATLRNVPIFPTEIGSDLDELYGNLGQDMVAGFTSFTLDFKNMTFSLGDPLPKTGKN
jgi:hypothetical protein